MIDEQAIGTLGSLDAEAAGLALRNGTALVGMRVGGTLDLCRLSLPEFDYAVVGVPVHIHQCRIDMLSGMATFNAPVELKDSRLAQIGFYSCFFTKGLTITGCKIHGAFDFMWGGHNRDCPIVFEDCTFEGFANFEDSWFMGPVIFRNVRFQMGSNLLGLTGPCVVKFDVPPLFENVQGDLQMPGLGPQ